MSTTGATNQFNSYSEHLTSSFYIYIGKVAMFLSFPWETGPPAKLPTYTAHNSYNEIHFNRYEFRSEKTSGVFQV